MKSSLLLLCLNFLTLLSVYAQISLAPTTVFADANGIGTLYVSNGSDDAQEVSIDFLFGYPGNDEAGNLLMIYNDSTRELQSGLGDRIRTFPRSFILAPGQQQTVRFQIRPDRTKAAGMYFTRVKVASNQQTANIGDAVTEGISTQVSFRLEQVIAAFYRYGAVSTGLEFTKLESAVKENSLVVDSEFVVTGNSPFLGSLQVKMYDANGEELAQHQQTLALYYEGKRVYTIPLPEGIEPGTYDLELAFKTERSDMLSTDLVQAEPIIKKMKVSF